MWIRNNSVLPLLERLSLIGDWGAYVAREEEVPKPNPRFDASKSIELAAGLRYYFLRS
jgi:hypothetical protein